MACPKLSRGWRITGGGGTLPKGGEIHTDLPQDFFAGDADTEPDDFWFLGATADRRQKMTAFAVCAKRPDLEYVVTSAPAAVTSLRHAETSCPAGMKAVGGGGFISNGYLATMAPYSILGPTSGSWMVGAHDNSGGGAAMALAAVCLHGPHLRARSASIDPGPPGHPRTVKSPCTPTSHVLGGGAYAYVDNTFQGDAKVWSSYPYDSKRDKDKVPDDGWAVRMANVGGSTADAVSFAVCGKP